MMRTTTTEIPKTQAILQAWIPFKEVIGVTSVHSEKDYVQATKTLDLLLDEIGDDEYHPLADVLDFLADQVKAYEEERFSIPKAKPHDMLRFLMEQHGLHQKDLSDCAPQSRLSEILAGKRSISKETAKRLAHRFNVHADLFL